VKFKNDFSLWSEEEGVNLEQEVGRVSAENLHIAHLLLMCRNLFLYVWIHTPFPSGVHQHVMV
jgi:hypothetical protein